MITLIAGYFLGVATCVIVLSLSTLSDHIGWKRNAKLVPVPVRDDKPQPRD
jgi:hypothetical protein